MNNGDDVHMCIACSSNIPHQAKKCVHCGAYQDWRRYIDIGNITIALLIALITVTTSLFTSIYNIYSTAFIDKKVPLFVARVIETKPDSVKVLYHNNGNSQIYFNGSLMCQITVVKDGVDLNKTRLNARYPKPSEVKEIQVVFFSNESGFFVESGKSSVVYYPLSEKFRNNITEFPNFNGTVPSTCFVSAIGLDGERTGDIIFLDEISVDMLQPLLQKSSEYQRYLK